MALLSLSLDDEHASLALRERVALNDEAAAKVLRTLLSHRNINAAVVVSTCMRTLVVVESERFHGAIDEITSTLAEVTGTELAEFDNALTIHFDRGVASHLFSVAAGLKSVVLGEFEILGQLRRSLERAQDEHVASNALTELFQRAIASGRRVRHETTIARGTTSFAHAAVEAAFAVDAPDDLHAVVVGAGQLGTGIVRSLLQRDGVARVTLCNRTIERAQSVADELGDSRVTPTGLDGLVGTLPTASLVIVAADVSSPVLTADHVAALSHDVTLVDLAVPHGIERDVARFEHVTRLDITTLRERIDRALDDRRDAVNQAELIVREDVEKFLDDQRARGAASQVAQLREYFDSVMAGEFTRRASDLDGLTTEQAELVHSLVRGVVAKLAHRPTTVLKDMAGTDQGVRLSEATRVLFGLD